MLNEESDLAGKLGSLTKSEPDGSQLKLELVGFGEQP